MERELNYDDAGIPLVFVGRPLTPTGTLTVANYPKWYSLYLVPSHFESPIQKIDFPDITDIRTPELKDALQDDSPFVDHVPNPRYVEALCYERGWALDPQAYEMIVGRWVLEAHPVEGLRLFSDN